MSQDRPTSRNRPTDRDHALATVTDLTVEVGTKVLLDRVSLRLTAGTVTALVGASGSGKTTTGLALLGEYPPGARVTGEVSVDGGVVGYVPQHPAAVLNPVRRTGALLYDVARQQVRQLPRPRRRAAARQRVGAALADAQITDGETLLRRHPHQLSGGQQQRVVLAQALLAGARILVADEPTTGQDALTRRRVVGRLRALATRGIAVLLLSHDLDVVRELADEVVVMRGGRVVEQGAAHRVLDAPAHPWTRELLAEPGTETCAGPRPSGQVVLSVTDLVAHHRVHGTRERVLDIGGLSLRAGEFLAVVGRSGSGKTTLARCLAGLHRDHSGRLRLEGAHLPHGVRERDREQIAAVQYVFQDARAAFEGHRSVLDQVARTAVRLRGTGRVEAAAEAGRTLAGLGLDEAAVRRAPGGLSGGELQRAALARALLARPRVLICDEITSGLDPVARRSLLDLLAGIARDEYGPGIVLITHDLGTAARAARIVVMDGGKVVEEGPREQILTAPRHPFTVALLEAASTLGAAARP